MSEYDFDHVGELLRRRDADWFGAQLLRLIAKADRTNREKLRQAFPEYVAAFERWERHGGEDEEAESRFSERADGAAPTTTSGDVKARSPSDPLGSPGADP